jgi:hypothetical protein
MKHRLLVGQITHRDMDPLGATDVEQLILWPQRVQLYLHAGHMCQSLERTLALRFQRLLKTRF